MARIPDVRLTQMYTKRWKKNPTKLKGLRIGAISEEHVDISALDKFLHLAPL